MPRFMPKLDMDLGRDVDKSIDLVRIAETLCTRSGGGYRAIHHTRIEHIYELAFLRIYIRWESFLEDSFLRYLCGRWSKSHGAVTLKGGIPYYKSVSHAETAMLTGKYSNYVLWGATHHALSVARTHVNDGPHEIIISSALTSLDHFSVIRNRVAHGQKDARVKFDNVTRELALKRYAGSRVGSFLRDWDTTSMPHCRWIESIATTLKALAGSIV